MFNGTGENRQLVFIDFGGSWIVDKVFSTFPRLNVLLDANSTTSEYTSSAVIGKIQEEYRKFKAEYDVAEDKGEVLSRMKEALVPLFMQNDRFATALTFYVMITQGYPKDDSIGMDPDTRRLVVKEPAQAQAAMRQQLLNAGLTNESAIQKIVEAIAPF